MPCTIGLPLATHSARSPPLTGDAVGVVWLLATWVHGPAHPGPVSTAHVPARLLEPDGARVGYSRRRHAAQRLDDDVEAVVLGHGDPDVGRVGRQGVRLGRRDQGRHGWPVRGTEVGRRGGRAADAGRRAPPPTRRAAKHSSASAAGDTTPTLCGAGARGWGSFRHDATRIGPPPGRIGAWAAQSGARRAGTLQRRAGRPGHSVARQPRRHRRAHAEPARRPACRGHRLGHLLRQPHARRGARGASGHRARTQQGATAGCCIRRPSGARSTTSSSSRAEPKLVNYHNITPARLLRDWEPAVAYEAALGRTQLARLAPQSRFAVADSAFNESELHALGYEGTAVVPLLIDMQVQERRARRGAGGVPGAAQGAGGRGRPALRRQDLAAQGAARPGQDARRAAACRGPRRSAASRGVAARGDLRAGVACVHRRTRPRRRRDPGRLGQRRGTGGVLPGGRRLRDGLGPRGVLRAAGRGDGPRRRRSSPTASPPSPRPSRGAGLVLDDKSPVLFAAAVGRVLADPGLRRVLSEAGRARAAGFDLAASTTRFVSLVRTAVGA